MHESAYQLMQRELSALPLVAATVLDVGSFNVNGSLRLLVEGRGWRYDGLDVRSGPNVDIVPLHPYAWDVADNTYDIVMTACALANVERPWLLVPEMARVLRPGGLLVIHCQIEWGYHPDRGYGDYWRFTPQGVEALFGLCDGLRDAQAQLENEHDVIGRAWKR